MPASSNRVDVADAVGAAENGIIADRARKGKPPLPLPLLKGKRWWNARTVRPTDRNAQIGPNVAIGRNHALNVRIEIAVATAVGIDVRAVRQCLRLPIC